MGVTDAIVPPPYQNGRAGFRKSSPPSLVRLTHINFWIHQYTVGMSETGDPSANPSISFRASDDNTQLIAVLPAGTAIPALNLAQLNKLLIEQGHSHWHLLNEGLAQVCSLLGKSDAASEIVIGDRLDGELAIKIADDATTVHLSVTAPIGGQPVSAAQVNQALAELEVTHGINQAAIAQALASNCVEHCLIAESTPPQHGEDARFESLITEAKDTRPQINDDGSVDYHEIGAFITVKAGDALMRKIPPTSGVNGVDVHGKVIPAKSGKDLAFSGKLTGVEIDADDRSLLRAGTGGQPEIVERGMNVSPVINIKEVDLSTGNIDFDGTVNIQGDVIEGMQIIATGDIIITGMMEGATLKAQGNIVVSKGVIGRGELRTATGEPGQGAALLSCEGSIEARFIENAIVQAGGNITVGELVSHSELSALNKIVVGKKGAKKGHILGGKTKAMLAIEAQILGSQANVKTMIEVGNNPELHAKAQQLSLAHEEKIEECAKLTTLINRLRGLTDDKSKAIMARALSTLTKYNDDLATIEQEKAQVETQDELTGSATVTVRKHAYPGVSITIGDKTHIVQDRTEAGSFVLEDKKIGFHHG